MACRWQPAAYGPVMRGLAPVTDADPGITMFGYFRSEAATGQVLQVLNRATGFIDANHYTFELAGDGTVFADAVGTLGSTSAGVSSTNTYALNTWNNAAARFKVAETAIWLNGVKGPIDTGTALSVLPTPADAEWQIGGRVLLGGTVFRVMHGCQRHVAVWDIALSDTKIAMLSSGAFLPTDIDPEHLVGYLNLLDEATAATSVAWDGTPPPGELGTGPVMTVREGDDGMGHDGGIFESCATNPTITPITPPELTTPYAVPVLIGLPYCSQGQLMRPDQGNDAGAAAGPAFAKTRRIHKYGLDVYRSRGVSVGVDFDTVADGGSLRPVTFKALKGTALPAPELFTGTVDGTVESKYDKEGKLAWLICRPYPLVIRAIGGFLATQDK